MFRKKMTGAVGVLIAVVLVGGYAGKSYMERRVVAQVTANLQAVQVSAEAVTFTLPARRLELRKLAFKENFGLGIKSGSVEAFEAVLPWGVLLAYKEHGPQLIAETCSFSGATAQMQDGDLSVGRGETVNWVQDMGLLLKIMQTAKPAPADLAAQCETTAFDRATLTDLRIQTAQKTNLHAGSVNYTDMRGLRLGAFQVDKLEFFMPDTPFAGMLPEVSGKSVQVFTLGTLRLVGLDVPGNALRLLYEMDRATAPDSEWVQQTLMPTMFGGKKPLFSRFELRDLHSPVFYGFSMQEYTFDWASVAPMQYTSTLQQATLPLDTFKADIGTQLPKLDALTLSGTTEVKGEANGHISEHITLSLANLADLDLRAELTIDPTSAGGAFNLWNYDPFSDDAVLRSLELQLVDKNLLGYLLYNMEGPMATGDRVLDMLPSSATTDEAAYTKMVDAVSTFIKHPGTLQLKFVPTPPQPLNQLWPVLLDPAASTVFTGTPGPRTLQDVITSLYKK